MVADDSHLHLSLDVLCNPAQVYQLHAFKSLVFTKVDRHFAFIYWYANSTKEITVIIILFCDYMYNIVLIIINN